MNKISKQSYNYYNREEKKENNFNENNDLNYNIQIEGIINDLKNKGYNDYQIKDIISSIQKNNNNVTNRISSYNTNIQNSKILRIKRGQESKLKGNNSFKKENENKQRNEYNKFNTKIYISKNISGNKNKKCNDEIIKRKIAEKMNIQNNRKFLIINNAQIIPRGKTNNHNINLLNDCNNIIKRKKLNSPFNEQRNKFNNYSFYDSKKKKSPNKEIKNNIIEDINNFNNKGRKILKYKNKKPKKHENNIMNKSNSNISQMRINNENTTINECSFSKNKPNTIENVGEKQIINNKTNINIELEQKKLINKQRSVSQFKHNLCFKNIKLNYNSINKNIELDKENKNKIISEYKPPISENNNIENYNNYIFHDISNDKNNISNNNTKKYFLKHYDSYGYIRKINRKTEYIDKQNNIIENSLNNINESINGMKNIKLDKNIRLVKKKSSYNNISKKIIYDLNNISNIPKISNNSHNAINSLNVEHNTINLVIEPSYQKKIDKNDLVNTKARNNSENKQITKFKIESQNEINYISRRKKYRDGQYEGIIINGKRELKGIMNYKNGGKYEGQWKNDKRHGKGIFISQNYNNPNLTGIKYEGEFNNDKIEGYGIGKYSSGDKYEGEWKNNKQYGRGVLNYVGGGKYVGEWKNGKLNGEGIYYLKNGERFEGKFEENKYNGYGKYYYNNGEYLEGIFQDDLPIGECILHKVDGTTEVKHYN